MPNRNSSPEKIIMVGPCRVSIFRKHIKDGKEIEIPKVLLEVHYRDKHGLCPGTHAMTIHDIPKPILTLQKTFKWVADRWHNRRLWSPSHTTFSESV